MTLATFCGFVVNLMIQYISPYLQNAGYANMQGKIGFVWGSFAVAAAVWVAFFLPEMSGRSLEELDELFEKKVSVWKFRKFVTDGIGSEVTALESGKVGIDGNEKILYGVEVTDVEDESNVLEAQKKQEV